MAKKTIRSGRTAAAPDNPISLIVVKPQRLPLTLKIPQRCPACQKLQTITLEQIIKGETVTFQWCCRACIHAWPVRRESA